MGRGLRLAMADIPTIANQDIALTVLQGGIVKQASYISYINNFYALAVLSFLLIPFVRMARNLESAGG